MQNDFFNNISTGHGVGWRNIELEFERFYQFFLQAFNEIGFQCAEKYFSHRPESEMMNKYLAFKCLTAITRQTSTPEFVFGHSSLLFTRFLFFREGN